MNIFLVETKSYKSPAMTLATQVVLQKSTMVWFTREGTLSSLLAILVSAQALNETAKPVQQKVSVLNNALHVVGTQYV